MSTTALRIKQIEEEIRNSPYHKGTEHHIGRLRARIAQLKDKLYLEQTRKSGGGGGGYGVKKQGDATIVLVGPPSAGKSTLLNTLTNAQSKVAPYSFTTVSVIPGMMKYRNADIQILDVPGLIEGAEEGKGRGREVLSVVRGSDLLVIMSDIKRPQVFDSITDALENNGIRINKDRPNVVVHKKLNGGIIVHNNFNTPSKETIKDIASEMGIKNAQISIHEKVTIDELVDSFSKSRVYVPAIFVLNKSDNDEKAKTTYDPLYVSVTKNKNLDKLRENIWENLSLVRVYLVKRDEEPNENNPMIMKEGDKLIDLAKKIGTEFAENKKKAVIWGTGAKFPSQEVSLTTKIQDGMMVRFV